MAIIIKNDRVQLVAETGEALRHEKALRVVEEDGVARAFELTCSCGEVTVIELDYKPVEATAAAPAAASGMNPLPPPVPVAEPQRPNVTPEDVAAAYVEGAPDGIERRNTEGT